MKAFLKVSVFALALAVGSSCNNNGQNESTSDSTATTAVDAGKTDTSHSTMAAPDTATVPTVDKAEAMLSGTYPDTTLTGSVKFTADKDGKVKMVLDVTVAAKAGKSVAVHLHEHGDCGDSGKMAHGHWNPTNAQHGKWGQGSFHSGDIGNVKLDAKGKGTLTLQTDLWTLGGKADKNILGKAVIVHGGVDDFTTQPTGNAGSRIGCGVIK